MGVLLIAVVVSGVDLKFYICQFRDSSNGVSELAECAKMLKHYIQNCGNCILTPAMKHSEGGGKGINVVTSITIS